MCEKEICSDDGLTRSKNKGELQVGLETCNSVPGKLTAEISRLNNEIKCQYAEIKMTKLNKLMSLTGKGKGEKYSGRSYSSGNKIEE